MMPLEFAAIAGVALVVGLIAGRLWDRAEIERERAHGRELAKLIVEMLARRGTEPPPEEPAAEAEAEEEERIVLGSGRRRHLLKQRELLSRRLARAGFTDVVAKPKPNPGSE